MGDVISLDTDPGGGVPLRISVDQQGALLGHRQAGGEIHGGGGLANPAFLIRDRYDSSHW